MHTPEALVPAGLELPPASPFDGPPAAEPTINLNRAQRRRLQARTAFDARLLGRVAKYDLAQHAATVKREALYANERAATYGLERAAKAMRLKGLLTRAEQTRVQWLCRYRRQQLPKAP